MSNLCPGEYISDQATVAVIPIILLRRSRLKLAQKLSLAVFLCFSLVMAIFALIRVSGIKIGSVVDHNWLVYWLYMEGCIACIMASVTPFRTLLVNLSSRACGETRKGPSSFTRERLLKKTNCLHYSGWQEIDARESLPKPPAPILTGLCTFIRRNHRTIRDSTIMMPSPDLLEQQMAQMPARRG